jgi:sugar phosphate permease
MLAWLMWGLATAFFYFDVINQVIPSALGVQLRTAFHADLSSFGLISSAYFYSYALMQIPIGITIDKMGVRKPLILAAFLASLSCFIFSLSTTPALAAFSRLLIGGGTAFAFISCLKLAENWFPKNRFATMVGLTNVVGMIGAVSGEGPISALAETIGWQQTLWIITLFGISLSALFYLFLKNSPTQQSASTVTKTTKQIVLDLKYLFSQHDAWFTGIYAAMINTSFIAFGALWGTLFIQTKYQLSQPHAAAIISLLFVGAIPGSFFFGWLTDRIKSYKLPMLIGASGGLLCMCLLLYIPLLPQIIACVLLFLIGFFCCGNVVAYANNTKVGAKNAEGTSLGFTNTWLIGGSALFQPLIGWLLLHHANQSNTFTDSDFQFALSSIVVSLTLALIMSLLIKENYQS